MGEADAKRKLAAILSADVKGYSRLMEDDEEATVRTITSYRDLMVTQILEQNGRVVDAKGDNLLAEFSSVVDAVRCAVRVQRGLHERNAELPEHRRMEFRIGVNLGDVIEEGDTLYGDGVNIAARLEALAESGGICISGTAFDHIGKRLSVGYEYLGEQRVKNIEKPVRVYKVLMEPDAAGQVIGEKRKNAKPWRWATLAAGIAVVLVIAALLVRHFYLPPPLEPASVEKMAFPLPDKPSIAVLPFENLSGDPEQEYFSDGLSDQVITALSKVSHLFVIDRSSSFTYKGRSVKVQQVAEELGVRYVLEGSVQRSSNRIRITAQLIDATKGHHLWAERYDRELVDVFAVQDEITQRIITALQVELTEGEQARVYGEATDNLEAYLKMLQARQQFYRMNKQGSVQARKLAEEAMQLDPDYASTYVLLALTHMMDLWFHFSESPKKSMKLAVEAAEKALALDDSNPSTYVGLCMLYIMQRRHDEAVSAGKRAVKLSPSSANAHMSLGTALSFAGMQAESIASFQRAIRLNPYPHSVYFRGLGNAYRLDGEYEKALTEYRKALQIEPEDLFTRLGLAATYISLGREEQARAEAAEVLRIHPGFSLDHFARTLPHKREEDTQKFVEALRKAGLT